MLSSDRSSSVRPKESTYLSTLRFLSVSWAELKLDTTRVAIPRHLRTEKQEAGAAPSRWQGPPHPSVRWQGVWQGPPPADGRDPRLPQPLPVSVCPLCLLHSQKRLPPWTTSPGTSEDTRPPRKNRQALRERRPRGHRTCSGALRAQDRRSWAFFCKIKIQSHVNELTIWFLSSLTRLLFSQGQNR